MENCKCVLLFRMEHWNHNMANNIIDSSVGSYADLFFCMDYFDFCLTITPRKIEELFGRYDSGMGNGVTDGIETIISEFNRNSSSKQVFSFCQCDTKADPFRQDKRYLIITTVSLNPTLYSQEDKKDVYQNVKGYKQTLRDILERFLPREDVFSVYNVMSNEDFAIALATDDPHFYYTEALPAIRGVEDPTHHCVMFANTYTIQNYAMSYDPVSDKYHFRGTDHFTKTHIIRARVSKEFWRKFYKFPSITNPGFCVADHSNLIGKYNVMFRLDSADFAQIQDCIVDKKLGKGDYPGSMNMEYRPINTVEDILYYIEQEGFSYVNERTVFSADVTEEAYEAVGGYLCKNSGTSAEETDINKINREYMAMLGGKIEKLKQETVTKHLPEENLNNLYRLSRVYDCCVSMGRSLYLWSTVRYLLESIELLVDESTRNLRLIKEDTETDREKIINYTAYLNRGVEAVNTLFVICTDKIYDNLQAPNYDVEYTYATEKILRAYAEALSEFCDDYILVSEKDTDCSGEINRYHPLVIPDPDDPAIHMQILFKDAVMKRGKAAALTQGTITCKKSKGEERLLLIHCPFDNDILKPDIYFPKLFHELGHYLRPRQREGRNFLFAMYISVLLRPSVSACFKEVLEKEYGWDIVRESEDVSYPNNFLINVVEEVTNAFITVCQEMVQDTLLDIFRDKLEGTTRLLAGTPGKLHESYMALYDKATAFFGIEDTEREQAKGWVEKKYEDLFVNHMETLKGDGSVADMLTKCFEQETECMASGRLMEYKKSCSDLYLFVEGKAKEKAGQMLGDAVEICHSYDCSALQGIDFTDKGIEAAAKGFRAANGFRDGMDLGMLEGLLDFYRDATGLLNQMRYVLNNIDRAEAPFEITDELETVQGKWIKNIYEKLEGDYAKAAQEKPGIKGEAQKVRRAIGLDFSNGLRSEKHREEAEKKFIIFMQKSLGQFRPQIHDLFDKGLCSFREAVADYAMCRLCNFSLRDYLEQFEGYFQSSEADFNTYRIAFTAFMLSCNKGDGLQGWLEKLSRQVTGIGDAHFQWRILKCARRLYMECEHARKEMEDSLTWINIAADKYRSENDFWGKLARPLGIEEILDFYLEYSYRNKCYSPMQQEGTIC